jgi:hypothetical protein
MGEHMFTAGSCSKAIQGHARTTSYAISRLTFRTELSQGVVLTFFLH